MSELHQDDFMNIENQEQHVQEVIVDNSEKKEMDEKCNDDIQDVLVQGNDDDDDDDNNNPSLPVVIQNCSASDSMTQQQQEQQQQEQQHSQPQDQQQEKEEEEEEKEEVKEEEKDQQENQEFSTVEAQTVTSLLLDSEKENQLSSSSDPTEVFVNYGFLRWNQARDEWLSNNIHEHLNSNTTISSNSVTLKNYTSNGQNHRHRTITTGGAIPIDVDDVLDGLFHPRWRTTGGSGGGATMNVEDMPLPCFARPVPLPQMVDILMDLWEAEGLDI